MATVTYGKCYSWHMYYGNCKFGKMIYGKSIMANETKFLPDFNLLNKGNIFKCLCISRLF